MTERKAIYRKAAQGMEQSDGNMKFWWSCTSIEAVGGSKSDQRAFVAMFVSESPFGYSQQTDLQLAFGNGGDLDARDHRILALCLMAAMVEAGDA